MDRNLLRTAATTAATTTSATDRKRECASEFGAVLDEHERRRPCAPLRLLRELPRSGERLGSDRRCGKGCCRDERGHNGTTIHENSCPCEDVRLRKTASCCEDPAKGCFVSARLREGASSVLGYRSAAGYSGPPGFTWTRGLLARCASLSISLTKSSSPRSPVPANRPSSASAWSIC